MGPTAVALRFDDVIVVVIAGLKGGVGKTTTAVYLAALAAAGRRSVTVIDADPQASAAEWIETSGDDRLEDLAVVEAPTDRLLSRACERLDGADVAVVDTPAGQERVLARALERATVAVVPTRVGGVETPRAAAVFELVPRRVASGLLIASARTFTRDYQEALEAWAEAGIPVWGVVPERVAIAAGPAASLSDDGLDAYRQAWRSVLRASR